MLICNIGERLDRKQRGLRQSCVEEPFRPLDVTCLINSGVPMYDESHLFELARRCRGLEKTAIEPEVIEQLRIWATELAEMAEQMECRAIQHEMAE